MNRIKYKQIQQRERQELKKSKVELKLRKKEYSISKKKINLLLQGRDLVDFDKFDKADKYVIDSKRKKKERKKDYVQKKKNYKRKYQGRKRRLIKKASWEFLGLQADTVLKQDEDLRKYVDAKYRYSKYRHGLERSVKGGVKVTRFTVRRTYGIGNRTYNTLRGRGFFKRTPEQFSWQNKLKKKIRNSRVVKKAQNIRNKTRLYTRFFEISAGKIYKNPLKVSGLFSILLFLIIFSLFASAVSPTSMKEKDMNDTWVYFTKLDREKSTKKVIYYSDIEEYIYYLNYRYDKAVKDMYGQRAVAYKKKSIPETREGRNYLEGMWEFLNADETNLKRIDDLIAEGGKYKLNDKEKKEFSELIKMSNEIGKFPYSRELDNFLFEKKDASYKLPMKISTRFGYTDESTKTDTTTFVAKPNQYIFAPMTGTVSIKGSDITIEQGVKKVTFYNLQNIRLTNGKQALKNEIIGEVKQEGNQVVKYEKFLEKGKNREWLPVNIGFYLPSVEYLQKTEIINDFDVDGDKYNRISEFVDLIKKFEPKATNEGIAAVLGTFDIESGVQPKRAEGDYLKPPIGASEGSWDNDEWLDIGGVQIYNGRYPNILKRGLGLGQWTDTADGSRRHTMLREYAKQKSKRWYFMDLQVDFIFNGDSPYYRQIFRDIIKSKDNIENLTRRFLREWEGGYNDKIDTRIERAKEFLSFIKDGGSFSGSFKDPKDQELWNKVASTHRTRPGSGGLQPHVSQLRAFLMEKFELGDVGGYRHNDSDGTHHGHGDGLALDLMLPIGSPKGKAITRYLIENYNDLRIYYIIYEQRFYTKGVPNIYGPANNWNLMPNRGSITENHYDHIHISFKRQGEA